MHMKPQAMTAGYLSSFCMELYLILQAGIPLTEGIEILLEGENDSQLKASLESVSQALEDGCSFKDALTQGEGFPQYMVDMIGVGEETGNLDRGLKALSHYYHRQEQLHSSVRRAVLYPAVLLVMLCVVLVVLVVEVFPMFNDVYAQLGGSMTGLAAVILQFGVLLKAQWVAAVVILAAVVAVIGYGVSKGQQNGMRVLLSKKLGLAVATSKVASALAMALHSGLDMDMAVEMAQNLTQHPELHEKLGRCHAQMAEGEGFATAITKEGIFNSLYCRMLGVGVKTGTTDDVMEEIALRCDQSAQDAVDQHIASVEPTLVVVMSVLVGVVLLSVMLPLASIMSSLG